MGQLPPSPFGDLLKRYRSVAGLTQDELAERAGLSARAISDLERGIKQHPHAETVQRLARALELGADQRANLEVAARRPGPPPAGKGTGNGHVGPDAQREGQPGGPRPTPLQLPIQPTPFIGREGDLRAVAGMVREEEVRLLTLIGPAGTGKTRLAVQVAADVPDAFPHGVYYVPLASIADPGLVPSAIAGALGVTEAGGRSLADALTDNLRGRRLLLVLDNVEHLLEAAPLVAQLLLASPEVTFLVTSRAVLHLVAERVYPVPPLSVPDLAHLPEVSALCRCDAVALFVERAQAAKADFVLAEAEAAAVAEICSRLDGLPLAIELAAARVRLFPPRALLGRLSRRLGLLTGGPRDLPARHHTLRNAIDWSYSLLTAREQRLFARLGCFAGGCTLSAVEAVCGGEGDLEADVLDGVASLIDQSLIRQVETTAVEPRLTMLETIREYALERLEEGGERDRLRKRHAEYYLALAEEIESGRVGRDLSPWVAQLEREQDNLRAALEWGLERADAATTALRLAAALAWFWKERARWSEGRRWLERLLALAETRGAARARALTGLAEIVLCQGDYGTAGEVAERSVSLWRTLDDRRGLATALAVLGSVATERADLALAHRLYAQALGLWRELGNARQMGAALSALGVVELRQGNREGAAARFEDALALARDAGDAADLTRLLGSLGDVIWAQGDAAAARRMLEEGVATARTIGDRWALGEGLHYLAWYLGRQGEYDRALELFQESVDLAREQGRREGWSSISWTLNHMGDVARAQGDTARAAALYEESLALFREQGHTQGQAAVVHNQAHLALLAGDTEGARALFAESLALFHQVRHTWSVADCVAGLGGVAAHEGQPERAALLFGAAEAIHEAVDASGTLIEPANRAGWERCIALGRQRLDAAAWEEAWAAGRALSFDQAIGAAVGEAAAHSANRSVRH